MNSKWLYLVGAALALLGTAIILEPSVLIYLIGVILISLGAGLIVITRIFNKAERLQSLSFRPLLIIQENESLEMEEGDEEDDDNLSSFNKRSFH